jgi:nucleoside-diphosphate-sugar epimerase
MTALGSVISDVERLTGRPVPLERLPAAVGDPDRTGADTALATRTIDWRPRVSISEGLAQQVEWHIARTQGGRSR